LLATPAWTGTQIVDTLRYRFIDPATNSNLANCTLYITDLTPSSDADDTYVPATLTYAVVNGVVNLTLQPNDDATPAGTSYSVQYACSKNQSPQTEIWIVPSGGPYTVRAVRAAILPTPSATISPSQLSSGGAADGQLLRWNAAAGQWQPAQLRYTAVFSDALTVSVPGSIHRLGTEDITVTCFDTATPPNLVEPDGWSVDPATYDITINFTGTQTGRCVLR